MSDTQSAPCGVGGFGFVPIAIDHPKIPDELRGDVARLLDKLGIANAYIDALEARVAELEAREKQAREDEAWAEDNGVVIDAEPVEKGWCAMLVREDGPLIEVPSAKGPTIHAAIRALREKAEGGAR